jgi:hypothetical protein
MKLDKQWDVIHYFSNRRVKSNGIVGCRSVDHTYIKGDRLYIQDSPVAQIYSWNRKIVIVRSFDYRSGWGNGINSWDIHQSFSKDWTVITSNDKLACSTDHILNKHGLFRDIICKHLEQIANCISSIEQVVVFNKMYDTYSLDRIETIRNQFEEYRKSLRIPKTLINKVYKVRGKFHKYQGWTRIDTSTVILDKKASYYFYGNIFTDKELDVLNRKNWIYNHFFSVNITGYDKKFKEEIYYDLDRKAAWEERVKATLEYRMKARARRAKELADQKTIEAKEAIKKWLNGNEIRGHYLYGVKVQLRFNKDHTLVETSRMASVPTEHAKLLFKKFKSCIEKNEGWYTNGSSIKIGHYTVSSIDKDDSGEWYIIAGCHTIYEREINDFIKRYKLNW